jgi:hypothetical protein
MRDVVVFIFQKIHNEEFYQNLKGKAFVLLDVNNSILFTMYLSILYEVHFLSS